LLHSSGGTSPVPPRRPRWRSLTPALDPRPRDARAQGGRAGASGRPSGRSGGSTDLSVGGEVQGIRPHGDESDTRRDLSSLARGWLLNLLGVLSSGLFGFIFGIVIARGLGASGAGVFFTAIALFTIATAGAQFGASTGLVRSIARFRALGQLDLIRPTLSIALLPILLMGIVLGTALFLFANEIAGLVLNGSAAETAGRYLRALAPFLPLAVASSALLAATRGFGTMVPLVAIEQVGKAILRPAFALVVLAGGLGSLALAFAWATPHALGFVAALVAVAVLIRRTPDATHGAYHPKAVVAGEFWRFAAPRGVAGIFQITLLWLDTILVAALASPHEAGIYKAAISYITQGTFANQAIVFVIGPLLSGLLAQELHERAQSVYQTATWWLSALSWPFYLALAVFAPLFMSVFGPEFVAGDTVLVILTLPMLLAMAAGPVDVVLIMAGKSSWNLLNAALALLTNIALNLLLIPPFGITGAATAWAATVLVSNVAALLEVRLFLKLRPLGSGFPIVALVSIGCYGALGLALRLAFGAVLPAFLVFAVLSTALYAILMWRFREALHVGVLFESMRSRKRGKIADVTVA
jgi:O-antigen/teichoic acid export membrane protein